MEVDMPKVLTPTTNNPNYKYRNIWFKSNGITPMTKHLFPIHGQLMERPNIIFLLPIFWY